MPTLDDDLLLRLRAADPAPAEPSVPPHEAVAQARRRRGAGRAGRLGAGGAVAALCAAVALPLGPAGAPALADVVARASAAVAVETGSIVRITTEVDVRAADHWRGRRTTWVRADGSGEPDVRMVSDAGVDETSADGVLRAFDPATGRTTRFRGRAVPSIVFRARALLDEARRGDAKPRLDGETTVRGRRALRVVITGAGGEPPLPGDRDVLYVDADTYRPLLLRKHSEGVDTQGRSYTYDLAEAVLDHRTLPDTPENRRLLTLRGPTR